MSFFADYKPELFKARAGDVRFRRGGSGPAILFLHGNPQTHVMWHQIAPAMAEHFTVYCPDIRGYGISAKPAATADSAEYSKRAMSGDLIEMMNHFGHEVFTIVAHDRGARVAHRMALDHPDRINKLALLDIIPTLEHFERTDMAFAMAYAHWFYLAMPAPFPEEMIGANPRNWVLRHCGRPTSPRELFHPDALDDYLCCIDDKNVVQGICEDYRAAAGIDLIHDRASRAAGQRIKCSLLVLWGRTGIIGKLYDPTEIWRSYCDGDVSGAAIDAGHYLAEQAPDAVLRHLRPFLGV